MEEENFVSKLFKYISNIKLIIDLNNENYLMDFFFPFKSHGWFFEEDKFQIFHLFKLIDMVDVWGKYLIQTRESYLNSKRFKRSLN